MSPLAVRATRFSVSPPTRISALPTSWALNVNSGAWPLAGTVNAPDSDGIGLGGMVRVTVCSTVPLVVMIWFVFTAVPSTVSEPTSLRPVRESSFTSVIADTANAGKGVPTVALVGMSALISALIGWSPISGNGQVNCRLVVTGAAITLPAPDINAAAAIAGASMRPPGLVFLSFMSSSSVKHRYYGRARRQHRKRLFQSDLQNTLLPRVYTQVCRPIRPLKTAVGHCRSRHGFCPKRR